jgi:peptidylprolyl isomerase
MQTNQSNRNKLILIGVFVVGLVVAVILATSGGEESSEPFDPDSISKPEVEVPDGEPPKELEIEDITEGEGTEAAAGDTLTMQYVGVNYSNGEEFDSSWESGEPFSFQLGAGSVIPGWDQGIAGMKVGGRRQLIIPPDLGYGAQGSPPDIGPNETLVFIVDLLDVQATPEPTPAPAP